jgi:selenium-binding protein 1
VCCFVALQWFAAGGLIAYLKKHPDIAVFDTSDAAHPRYSHSITGVHSHVTDEFLAVPMHLGGGFVVTQMGSVTGGSPGRVARLNKHMKLVGEYPRNANHPSAKMKDANPHGVDVDFRSGKMLTTDFLEVASAVDGPVV